MAADLTEKTLRYKGMLNEAIADVQKVDYVAMHAWITSPRNT